MEREPAGDLAEALGRDRQLDRATRMGTYRVGMEVANRSAEPLRHLSRHDAGEVDFVGVEVEVDVEVARIAHGVDMGMLVPGQKGQLPFRRVCATCSSMTATVATVSYYYPCEVGIG